MPIPKEIIAIIDRLNQELNQIEDEATEGINLATQLLNRFSNNALLIQYLAYFNATLFFAETSRRQIQFTVENLSLEDVLNTIIQEGGEDLGTLLGRVIELKINVNRTKTRLENWR